MAIFNEGFIKNWVKKQINDTKKWQEEHSGKNISISNTTEKKKKDESHLKKQGLITKEEYDFCLDILHKELKSSPLEKYITKSDLGYDLYKTSSLDYITLMSMDQEEQIISTDSEEGEDARKEVGFPVDFKKFCKFTDNEFLKIEKKVAPKIKAKYNNQIIFFYAFDDVCNGDSFFIESNKPKED